MVKTEAVLNLYRVDHIMSKSFFPLFGIDITSSCALSIYKRISMSVLLVGKAQNFSTVASKSVTAVLSPVSTRGL